MFNQPINRWWNVVAGALSASVGAGVVGVYMFGIFAKSIGEEFGWSRASVSLGLTAFALVSGIGSFTLGMAIDRLGMRKVTIIYVLMFGLSIALVPFLPAGLGLFIATFGVAGFFGSAATVLPYATAVCAWFNRKRGLALGLVNAGTGIGAALMPLYAHFLLSRYGWRGGYWGVAALVTFVPIVMLLFFVRLPSDYEQERRMRREAKNKWTGGSSRSLGSVVRSSRPFWLIVIGIFNVSVATFGIISQLVPIVTDRGYSSLAAAGILTSVGVGSLISRLAIGFAMDRIFAPYVTAGVFALAMVGMGVLTTASSLTALTFAGVLVGIAAGAEGDILTFLVSRYFPMTDFGSVTGAIWVSWAWGGALGTYLLGLSFDLVHSYNIAIISFIAAVGVGAIAVLRVGPYAFPPHREEVYNGTTVASR
ncbi:MFS transporter [Burkholderia sp. Ac-20353]|uniref:MFS transporter n=1 Tax=Burkholderia sp. Ac-20353 TaxID=2703894 RepID=UPI00197BF7B9|nr:MFS transporter [Burkholderia sp. Ac-20353]MBN3785525.1 MFS transporter [Burkholderia sp. Ac-20353]